MKNKKYDYYPVVIRRSEQMLELESLADFTQLVNAHQVKQILTATAMDAGAPVFAFAHSGALYTCPSIGFKSLEDFQSSTENGFPDAATFYAGLENNCTTYAEYQTALAHGITDASVMNEMKKQGYVDGYAKFEKLRNENASLPRLENITNVKDLFEEARQKGFTGFQQFLTAYQAGFTSPLDFKMAKEKGLDNAKDYEVFNKGMFLRVDDFKQAKPLGITTQKEFDRYHDLNLSAYPGSSFDELLLISVVSKLPNNEKRNFKELYDSFVKEEQEYRQPNQQGELKLPKWYTKRMRNEEDVKNFLVSSDKIKHFGTYDAEKKVFETKHINLRKVVVDGSNVAYNSAMASRNNLAYGAELQNILLLVKKLREEYLFEDIHVISDAALIHKVKDKGLLPEIKKLCKYTESAPGVPADIDLINQVKKHHCLVITNDNFTDWKLNDQWIADNLQFYRLTFMLNDGKVVIPYMDKYQKK